MCVCVGGGVTKVEGIPVHGKSLIRIFKNIIRQKLSKVGTILHYSNRAWTKLLKKDWVTSSSLHSSPTIIHRQPKSKEKYHMIIRIAKQIISSNFVQDTTLHPSVLVKKSTKGRGFALVFDPRNEIRTIL